MGIRSADAAAPVLVVGASVSGLMTAIALARRGVPVRLVDADLTIEAEAAPGAGDMLSGVTAPGESVRRAPRRATPQAAHSHAFLARCRELLRAEAPDVVTGLQHAGCREVRLVDQRPATVPRHAPHPEEEDLVVLAARRTTFESVLRQAARQRPEITLEGGRRASGLVVDVSGRVARTRAVTFDQGPAITARLVVDATGRRTPMPGWLAAQGIPVAEQSEECGIAYLSRFYRRAPGAPELPLDRGFAAGGSFDSYSCLVFPADAGTFSVTFGVLPEDRPLRRLLDGDAFDAAVRAIPRLAPWIEADAAEPISEVRLMAGLHNRIQRVHHGDRPAVLGWTAVGDAAATTNPAHSRGCSLAAVHAVGVAAAVAEHRDLLDLAETCAALVEQEQAPWVADSIEQDRQRLARWRSSPEPPPPHDDIDPRSGVGRLRSTRLTNGETYRAAQHDAYVWRRFNRLQQLLERPDSVLADPQVVARVRAVQAARHADLALDGSSYVFQAVRPTATTLDGPSRDELVDLLDGATAA